MVDVSNKPKTARQAVARGVVRLNAETFSLVREGKMKKGDVLAVAQIAGIMAAKKTPEIIPMSHPVALTGADLRFFLAEDSGTITIEARVRCTGETGVEMEALTSVAVAALAIYDMCKSIQRDIVIGDIRLVAKSGGASGDYKWEGD
jgi:cyclic pyranopterin phosphate synthase